MENEEFSFAIINARIHPHTLGIWLLKQYQV